MLRQFASSRDPELLRRAANQLGPAITQINDLLVETSIKRLSIGPSKSPHANILGNALRGYVDGMLPLSSLQHALGEFDKALGETHAHYSQLAATTRSGMLTDELQRIGQAMSVLHGFSEEISACQTTAAASRLLARYETVVEACNAAAAAFESCQMVLEQSGKIPCVRCHHFNAAGSTQCEACQAALPKVPATATTTTFGVQEGGLVQEMPLTPDLERLFAAVNQIAENEMAADDFLQTVDATQRLIDKNERDVSEQMRDKREKLAASPAEAEEKERTLAALERAFLVVNESSALVRSGLQMMRNFPREQNREDLVEAVRRVYRGFSQLYEVHLAAGRPVQDTAPQVLTEKPAISVERHDYSVTVSSLDHEDDGESDEHISNLLQSLKDTPDGR